MEHVSEYAYVFVSCDGLSRAITDETCYVIRTNVFLKIWIRLNFEKLNKSKKDVNRGRV